MEKTNIFKCKPPKVHFTIRDRVPYNKLLTNLACSSRKVEYWPSVVFVPTKRSEVCTATTLGQYSPVRPSHSVSKRLLFNHLVQTFLYWYDIILAKQHWTVVTTLVEIKKCNLQSYKSKPTVLTLLPDVTPSNVYTFCTITDTVHFTELSLAQTCSVAEGNFTYSSSLSYLVLFLAH